MEALNLFQSALGRAPEEREAFLREACGADEGLRAEVDSLLRAHAEAGSFLEVPVAEFVFNRTRDGDASKRVGSVIGSFRLSAVIGEGGMGVVYEAEQTAPRRTVALKMMRAGMRSASTQRRFQVEAEILGRLHHPSIAQVYEVGMHAEDGLDLPYFAMELVQGARTILGYAGEERLGIRARAELFSRVCDAVHHGHQKGIIHRDLKPSNVLVDSTGVPKVIDFGVARATDAEHALTTIGTDVQRLVGTLQYMSPEAFAGDPHALDTRSDVYSLGVVLYELLTGCLPHAVGTTSLAESARVVQQEVPARPSRIRRELRGDLETILLKALAKDRERRYGSAAGLAADLRRFLAREPIEARPPSALYHARKLVARHRAASLLVAALLASVVGFGIGMAVLARKAQEEAEVAERVTAFMVDLFAHASPTLALGEDIPVSVVVDAGVRRIEHELRDQPVARARLQSTLGHTYQWLGKLDEAEQLYRDSFEARAAVFGEDDPDAQHCRIDIGNVLVDRGDYSAAEAILRDVLQVLRETGQADSPVMSYGLQRLGFVLGRLGEYGEGEELLRSAVRVERERESSDDVALAGTLIILGGLLQETNRDEEALPLFEDSLAILLRIHPAGHPNIPMVQANIARCRTALGDHAGALELLEPALETTEHILEQEASYASILRSRAHVLSAQGRRAEAEADLRRALAIQERTLAAEHPDIAFTCNDLGSALNIMGEFAEAEGFLRRALAIDRRSFDGDHPRTAIAAVNLADVLASRGEFAEAERLGREGVAMHRRLNPDGAGYGGALATLSWALIQQGRLAEGEELAHESIAVLVRLPATDIGLGIAHNLLAFVHNMRGDGEVAEEECLRAFDRFERTGSSDLFYLCYTHYQLGWARLNQGDPEGAEASMRDSIALFRQLFPGGHPDLVWPLGHLGEVLVAEHPREAVELFKEALALRRRYGVGGHWLRVSLQNLASAHRGLGEDAAAEALLAEDSALAGD